MLKVSLIKRLELKALIQDEKPNLLHNTELGKNEFKCRYKMVYLIDYKNIMYFD